MPHILQGISEHALYLNKVVLVGRRWRHRSKSEECKADKLSHAIVEIVSKLAHHALVLASRFAGGSLDAPTEFVVLAKRRRKFIHTLGECFLLLIDGATSLGHNREHRRDHQKRHNAG